VPVGASPRLPPGKSDIRASRIYCECNSVEISLQKEKYLLPGIKLLN
jgi:hypothetical protein